MVIEYLPPGPFLRFFSLGLSDEARFDFFPEPVGVALDVDRGGVVQDPVQDGRGDDRVAEDLVPLGEAPVRGQDQRFFFVPPGDELEEQMRAVTVDGDVADLVDNQKLGLAVELQPLLDPVLRVRLGQGGDKRHGLGEVRPVTFCDGLDAQGHG
jgi:hypothetical protein